MWKMKGYRKIAVLAVMAGVISISCSHKADISAIPDVSFKSDIKPLMGGNCAMSGCHSEGRRSLVTYDDVMSYGHVSSGNPAKSTLYQVIANKALATQMPPNGYLSENNIKTIYLWILQGAKNN